MTKTLCVVLGPLFTVLFLEAHEEKKDAQRHDPSELPHELGVTVVDESVDEIVAYLPRVGFPCPDPRRRKHRGKDLAVLRVVRGVGVHGNHRAHRLVACRDHRHERAEARRLMEHTAVGLSARRDPEATVLRRPHEVMTAELLEALVGITVRAKILVVIEIADLVRGNLIVGVDIPASSVGRPRAQAHLIAKHTPRERIVIQGRTRPAMACSHNAS